MPTEVKSKTFTVNRDESGNLIMTQLNDSGTLMKDSQDKDFFASNEFSQHDNPDGVSMDIDGKQRSKRSLSNSEVGDVELDQNQDNRKGGGRAKSARLQDDGNRPTTDVFANKGKSRVLIIKSLDNLKIFLIQIRR